MAGKSVLVTGGAESAGLAAVKALRAGGHEAAATTAAASGALTIRIAGGLPVFPDPLRPAELASAMRYAKADAVLHCAPQTILGVPQVDIDPQASAKALAETRAIVAAAAEAGAKRMILLGAIHPDKDMQAAEAALRDSGLAGVVLRVGCIYGGQDCATSALADMIKASQRIPSGDHAASFIHEDDVAAALLAVLATNAGDDLATLRCADARPVSPNAFALALASALGLSAPRFVKPGLLTALRGKSRRDELLARERIADTRALRDLTGWSPRYPSIESGLDATALTWRLNDAARPAGYHESYTDAAAEAIAARKAGMALPKPAAAPAAKAAPAVAEVVAEAAPAPINAAAPPPSDGPTPWNEDEAKREARRRKALERKAKRAAKRAGG